MSTQSQNPGTGQQDQKQRNPGSMPQDQDKYAREDNDKPGANKDKDQTANQGGQGDDDKGHGSLGKN